MLNIALCDDEKHVLDLLYDKTRSALAVEDEEANIALFTSGEELTTAYEKNESPFDIVFLDIKMEKLDGIKTAEFIRARDDKVLIVFITSSAEYVFRGYEVKAFRYLMKTELDYGFAKVLRETINELRHSAETVFTFRSGSETISIETRKILYFESIRRIVRIVATDGEYKTYAKLTDIENELAAFDFIRCHQSYLVNARKIQKLSAAKILLKNGDEIPVSKKYGHSVNEAYLWTMR